MFTRERELENMVVKVGSEVDGPPVLHQASETSCAAADIQHLPPTEFEKCGSFEIGQARRYMGKRICERTASRSG